VGEAIINKKNKTALVAIEAIASRIVVLRGHRVMLDADSPPCTASRLSGLMNR
jgi:hypothetical protein